ncbi:hypothetical protein ASD00_32120 [Ensifer sp. Root31]|uniref:GntR family transcriptional regulator n=1 Tax=Ensifer sp. Root31 TaxID=1736512 RepID=UPI000709ED00|nr:GntR family transcriptional regulator [Ensifer sp. Root31]KQU85639.1 hypothetical protein ASD00_32120 [Ensifer sp. Root31]
MDKISIGHRTTLASHVYDAVRKAIVSRDLEPGSLYSVASIAERLDVSRTPVREALLKLQDQGMIKFERNRGARILSTTVRDLRELFSLRLLLEVPSAHIAAQRANSSDLTRLRNVESKCREAYLHYPEDIRRHLEPDAHFHQEIAKIAGNMRLASIVGDIFAQQMMADLSTADVRDRKQEIVADHSRIVEAISASDGKGAALAMRDHLIGSATALTSKETGEDGVDLAFFLGISAVSLALL